MPTQKDPKHFRLLFQNLNGLPYRNLSQNTMDFISNCQQHAPDFIGFCEHNLYPSPPIIETFKNAVHRLSKHTRSVLSVTPIKSATPFKPGGTGAVTCNLVTGRVTKSISDSLGRWIATTLQGKNTQITIIVAYQSPVSNSQNTCMMYHKQQLISFQENANSQKQYNSFTDKSPRQFFVATYYAL